METAIMPGMKLKCIFDTPLPGNTNKPSLEAGKEYQCESVHLDSEGYAHIDVGLPLKINYVSSYATKEELPGTTHWCHPNRFVIVR